MSEQNLKPAMIDQASESFEAICARLRAIGREPKAHVESKLPGGGMALTGRIYGFPDCLSILSAIAGQNSHRSRYLMVVGSVPASLVMKPKPKNNWKPK